MQQKPIIIAEVMELVKSYLLSPNHDYQEATVRTTLGHDTINVIMRVKGNNPEITRKTFNTITEYDKWVKQLRRNKQYSSKASVWRLRSRHGLIRVSQLNNGTFKIL